MRGKRYGKLLVVRCVGRVGDALIWRCRCDCGQTVDIRGYTIRQGRSLSCGCGKREGAIRANTTHGFTRNYKIPPEYRIWVSMKRRCLSPNDPGYKNYGGRGIRVCARWLHSFSNFIHDMGWRPDPHLMLERKNNDGNYDPLNCCWATRSEQNRNQRRSVKNRH